MTEKQKMPWTDERPPITALNVGLGAALVALAFVAINAADNGSITTAALCMAGTVVINAYAGEKLNGSGRKRGAIYAGAAVAIAPAVGTLFWLAMNENRGFLRPSLDLETPIAIAITAAVVTAGIDALGMMFEGHSIEHTRARRLHRDMKRIEELRSRGDEKNGR